MSNYKEIIYWDSTIFIALLTDDPAYNRIQKEGIRFCIEKIRARKTYMITSDITQIEVLPGKMTPEAEDKFQKMFYHPNISRISQHAEISKLARQLREYYVREKARLGSSTKMLEGMDAIHLATAIYYKVNAFHTFDNGGKKGISLLKLDGDVAGHPLHICEPPPPIQGSMDFEEHNE